MKRRESRQRRANPMARSSTPKPKPAQGRRPAFAAFSKVSPGELFWDLLTFDRLMTGPVIHLIYWAGLALLVMGGFSVVGGAVGVALREPGFSAFLLAVPMVVAGLLAIAAGALIWRSFCEFYVAVFRISDDLKVMRAYVEQDHATPPTPAPRPVASDPDDADLLSKM